MKELFFFALCSENGKVISKRLDNFREKTQPKMGEVHDPIAETLDVPPGHTFGVTVPVDKFGELDMYMFDTEHAQKYGYVLRCRCWGSGAHRRANHFLRMPHTGRRSPHDCEEPTQET